MLEVKVTFGPQSGRSPEIVRIGNYDALTPRSAIAARNIAAGINATANVSDGEKTYHVAGNHARKA